MIRSDGVNFTFFIQSRSFYNKQLTTNDEQSLAPHIPIFTIPYPIYLFLFSVRWSFLQAPAGRDVCSIANPNQRELRSSGISIKWHLQQCRLSEAQEIVIRFFLQTFHRSAA